MNKSYMHQMFEEILNNILEEKIRTQDFAFLQKNSDYFVNGYVEGLNKSYSIICDRLRIERNKIAFSETKLNELNSLKKPNRLTIFKRDIKYSKTFQLISYQCPNCGVEVVFNKRCPICNQNLDWMGCQ